MTISIQNGQLSLQHLQARQAFQTKPKSATPPQPQTAPNEDIALAEAPRMDRQLRETVGPIFQAVNQMAQELGYVGLTQSQVARAYVTGSSLLADYQA